MGPRRVSNLPGRRAQTPLPSPRVTEGGCDEEELPGSHGEIDGRSGVTGRHFLCLQGKYLGRPTTDTSPRYPSLPSRRAPSPVHVSEELILRPTRCPSDTPGGDRFGNQKSLQRPTVETETDDLHRPEGDTGHGRPREGVGGVGRGRGEEEGTAKGRGCWRWRTEARTELHS